MTTLARPLSRLTGKQDIALYLIREELKSRKLFQAFHTINMDDCDFQPHLDELILQTLGLNNSDEMFSKYTEIMERRSAKIEADYESIMAQSMKTYIELINLKKVS